VDSAAGGTGPAATRLPREPAARPRQDREAGDADHAVNSVPATNNPALLTCPSHFPTPETGPLSTASTLHTADQGAAAIRRHRRTRALLGVDEASSESGQSGLCGIWKSALDSHFGEAAQ